MILEITLTAVGKRNKACLQVSELGLSLGLREEVDERLESLHYALGGKCLVFCHVLSSPGLPALVDPAPAKQLLQNHQPGKLILYC
jgi:hypothetical protein